MNFPTAFITSVFLVLVCSLMAVGAWAAEPEPSAEEIEEARALYTRAVEAVKSDRHEEAANLFRKSWRIIGKSELLYNEAVSRARAGDFSRALEIAIEADAAGLPPSFHVKNSARIQAWRAMSLAVDLNEKKADRLAEEALIAAQVAQPVEKGPSSPRSDGWSAGEIAGISMTAAGAGALVAALIVDIMLTSKLEDVEKAAESGVANVYRGRVESAENLQLAERVLLISGAALVIAGVVVWLVSGDDSEPLEADGDVALLRF